MDNIIVSAHTSVKTYINQLWEEMAIRFSQTDLSPSATSFSEAPAEGIFSIIEKIVEGRELLSVENINALARIRVEGPGVATMEGYQLSKEALKLWNSRQGERFTTRS